MNHPALTPWIRTGAILVIIVSVALVASGRTNAPAGGSITVLTKPIPVLAPHEHESSRGDTVEEVGHAAYADSDVFVVPKDLWVSRIELAMKNAPQSVLHHMQLINLDKEYSGCPGQGAPLMAAGSETPSDYRFDAPYVLFIPAGTRLAVSAMFHNPEPPLGTGVTYENVAAGFTLVSTRSGLGKLHPVSFELLALEDLPACRAVFTVPAGPGEFVKKSSNAPAPNPSRLVFPKSGTVLVMGGHIHPWEGGRRLDVFLNGLSVASLAPVPEHTTPETWTAEFYRKPIRVKAGDTLTLGATYENPYSSPLTGAMGMLGVFVAYDEPK